MWACLADRPTGIQILEPVEYLERPTGTTFDKSAQKMTCQNKSQQQKTGKS